MHMELARKQCGGAGGAGNGVRRWVDSAASLRRAHPAWRRTSLRASCAARDYGTRDFPCSPTNSSCIVRESTLADGAAICNDFIILPW